MHPVTVQLRRFLDFVRQDAIDKADEFAPAGWELSPWATWLMLALVRHVERQRWVGSIAVSELGADLNAMSAMGALAHPPRPQSGLVPDNPSWEYYFHGRGCCLTHRVTGESIDVDFYDGTPDWIDDFFFLGYLKSLKQPESVEQRLSQLHPTLETALLAFDELLDAGVLRKHADSKVVRPLEELQALERGIDALNERLASPEWRLPVACLLGDWMLARDCDPACREFAQKSQECLDCRRQRLKQLFGEAQFDRVALQAYCDLFPDASEMIAAALRKSPCGTTSAALRIISARPDEDWTPQVYELMSRTDPNGELPQPYVWTTCAAYLLRRRSHVDAIRGLLPRVGRRCLGDAAILALEHFPELAVELFRRAIRSDVPLDRNTAAAALAILDRPWSHQILLDRLAESTDQEATLECRAALAALPHPHLHAAVARWERDNPHERETGPYISMSEVLFRQRDQWMQHEMEQLHDRVLVLRQAVPPMNKPESRRRWWWPF